jgi:exopolysaccharide biosynthesis polyprenyl glycosylphosphotransferase
MIAYRQRGLTNLYSIFVGVFAAGLLLAYAKIMPRVSGFELLLTINHGQYALAVLVGMFLSRRLLQREGHRLHDLPPNVTLSLALKQAGVVAACVFALAVATKDQNISRLYLGSYLLLLSVTLTLLHRRVPRWLATVFFAESALNPTVFVGAKTGPSELLPWLKQREHLGIQIVGYLADDSVQCGRLDGVPYLGPTAELQPVLHERRINQVILLDWMDNPAEMARLVEVCEAEGCRLLIHNRFASNFARNLIGLEEGGQHFLMVQEEPLEDPLNRTLKRALDLCVALPVVLLVIPPLTILVWAVQQFQAPGAVFFVRDRGGKNRRSFAMLKYRSMYVDSKADESKQAFRGDGRMYPFGRFLRKTSLDEVPQFVNVLKGQMTVVGPRPHLLQHDEAFSRVDRTYRIRTLVKPGITGLAQVNGFRGEISDVSKLQRRIYWDRYYLTNWTIWMDVSIILRTVRDVIFPPKGAV